MSSPEKNLEGLLKLSENPIVDEAEWGRVAISRAALRSFGLTIDTSSPPYASDALDLTIAVVSDEELQNLHNKNANLFGINNFEAISEDDLTTEHLCSVGLGDGKYVLVFGHGDVEPILTADEPAFSEQANTIETIIAELLYSHFAASFPEGDKEFGSSVAQIKSGKAAGKIAEEFLATLKKLKLEIPSVDGIDAGLQSILKPPSDR